MALFGLFGKQDDAAAVKKLVNKLTQKFGPAEDRQAAADKLFAMGTPESLTGLLQRFVIRSEPSMVDEEQKQWVYEALVEAGEAAIEPLRTFIIKQDFAPTWALKALESIVAPDAVTGVILAALDHVGPDYARDPEKKVTLLRHLEPLTDERIGPGVLKFLDDPAEDVRIATLTVLRTRPLETMAEPMIQLLLRSVEEKSERLRRASAEALSKSGLSVKGHRPAVEAALPPGFSVDKDGKVRTK